MQGRDSRPDAKSAKMARFRHRPHANPLADNDFQLPCTTPDEFPYALFYPKWTPQRSNSRANTSYSFDLVDIGCGYGDFVKNMGQAFPDLLIIGLELRDVPVALGQQTLLDNRNKNKGSDNDSGTNHNTAIIRCNVIKHLPRILAKYSVTYFTIMFPDPQFKVSHARRRVVSPQLLSEYAYYLVPGGYLLACSDLEDLYVYMHDTIISHPLFVEVPLPSDDDATSVYEKISETELCIIRTILALMYKTADAERHMRKDTDKTVYRGLFKRTSHNSM